MVVRMIVDGQRTRRMKAFHEEEEFPDRKRAIAHLRSQLGGVYGQSDEDYFESLKTVGVTVTFEEI